MTTLGRNAAQSARQIARWMRGAIWSRPIAGVSRLLRDRGGVTSLEFALVFPILMVFIMGTLELDRVMFMELQLQQAMADVSRFGFTGQAAAAALAQDDLPVSLYPHGRAEPGQLSIGLPDPAGCVPERHGGEPGQLSVRCHQAAIHRHRLCQSAGTRGPNLHGPSLRAGAGATSSSTTLITYYVPFATGAISHQLSGGIPVSGFAIVYNEPFSS